MTTLAPLSPLNPQITAAKQKTGRLQLIVIACLSLLVLGLFVPPLQSWVGRRPQPLEFVVLDRSGRPLAGAELSLVHPYDPQAVSPKTLTGKDGRARIASSLHVSGGFDGLRVHEVDTVANWLVQVTKDDTVVFCAYLSRAGYPIDAVCVTDPPLGVTPKGASKPIVLQTQIQ